MKKKELPSPCPSPVMGEGTRGSGSRALRRVSGGGGRACWCGERVVVAAPLSGIFDAVAPGGRGTPHPPMLRMGPALSHKGLRHSHIAVIPCDCWVAGGLAMDIGLGRFGDRRREKG